MRRENFSSSADNARKKIDMLSFPYKKDHLLENEKGLYVDIYLLS